MNDSSTIFFYFFSTTAQVFAAVLGVIGVFAIFNLERINKKIDGLAKSAGILLSSINIRPSGLQQAKTPEYISELSFNYPFAPEFVLGQEGNLADNDNSEYNRVRADIRNIIGELKATLEIRKSFKSSLKAPTALFAGLIIISLIGLGSTSLLSVCFMQILLVVVLLIFA